MSKRNALWVVISDLHFPETHWPTIRAAVDFITRNKRSIAGLLLLGDEFHNECISPYTKGKPLLRRPGSYLKETADFDCRILKQLEKALPRTAKRVVITGNHSAWETTFIEENPQFAGIERFKELKLADRGWKIVPIGREYRIGKLCCIHGDGLITGFAPQCPA